MPATEYQEADHRTDVNALMSVNLRCKIRSSYYAVAKSEVVKVSGFSLKEFSTKTKEFTDNDYTSRFGINLSRIGHYGYYLGRKLWDKFVHKRLVDETDSINPIFPVPQALRQEDLDGATLFESRRRMISSLPRKLVWAEIGVWEGEFSAHILGEVAPRELHLFDLDFARVDAAGHVKEGGAVKYHKGDSSKMLSGFPDEYFDAIYIDGDHALIGTCRDAAVALQKIKPDGMLIFNDYIIFSHIELYPYGTVPVVNSICRDFGWRVSGFALHRKMYCDVMLQRKT